MHCITSLAGTVTNKEMQPAKFNNYNVKIHWT